MNGWLVQDTSGEDGRGRILSLTDNGRAVVTVFAGILDDIDEKLFGHLDAATRGLIVANMREIIRRHGLRAAPAVTTRR